MPDQGVQVQPGSAMTFHHDRALFATRVWGEGILSLVVALFSLYKLLLQQGSNPLWFIPLLVAGYTFYRLLMKGGTPRAITITSSSIELVSPSGTRTHQIIDLEEFRVRNFYAAKTLYVVVKSRGASAQKHWIEWTAYDQAEGLLPALLDIERRVHPDGLKERARQSQARHERAT